MGQCCPATPSESEKVVQDMRVPFSTYDDLQAVPSDKSVGSSRCPNTPTGLSEDDLVNVAHGMAATFSQLPDGKSEEGDLRWLNFMLTSMWPFMRKAIEKRGKAEMLQRALVEFNDNHPELQLIELGMEFDPGTMPPKITGIRTAHKRHRGGGAEYEEVQIDVDFVWKTKDFRLNPQIQVLFGGVRMNIKNVAVIAVETITTMSVVLAPLTNDEPCFGAIQVYFNDLPDIRLTVEGLSEWPVVSGMLISVMEKMSVTVVSDSFVLPHRMMLKARPDVALETLVSINSPLPLGLLEVVVVEGRDLQGNDFSVIARRTSDPYVLVRIGDSEMRTSTIQSTTSPKWSDGPDFLPIYNFAQACKISVYDDDMVTDDDQIGYVQTLTVFDLIKQMKEAPAKDEGIWLPLVVKKPNCIESAGELKLRVRFLVPDSLTRTADEFKKLLAHNKKEKLPRLITVKLLGMEGMLAPYVKGAKCLVKYTPPDKKKRKVSIGAMTLGSTFDRQGIANATGFGMGKRTPGMPSSLRTSKAKLWASMLKNKHGPKDSLSPEAVRAVEQLRYRENWPDDKIGAMFGVSKETVTAAAELRANFEVVWHQALHFVQAPDAEVFEGAVDIAVHLPGKSTRHGAHVLNQQDGHLYSRSSMLSACVDKTGLIGMVRLDLHHDPTAPDEKWHRRVRARLRRPNIEQADVGDEISTDLQGEHQCDPSIGLPVPGLLIEFVVEIRTVAPGNYKDYLEVSPPPVRARPEASAMKPGISIAGARRASPPQWLSGNK